MEPIRVLHNIVLMDAGGIETLVMNLYRHIDKEQILFDFLVHRPQEGYYEKEIREYGGKVYRTRPFNPLHMREYKKECMNILTSHPEYKVFHVHQELGLWTLDYAHQAGIPTRIAHAHNAKTVVNLKYFFFLYEKMFIKKHCTDMFMCSKPAGEWLFGKQAVQDGKVKYINNSIETDRFKYNEQTRRDMREKLGVGDKIVIGHVGRFAQPKNHTFILDVFNEIHRMNKNTVLVLCGEGKLEDDIKAKTKALGLENDVIFTGVMDTSVLYQALDLFLFPSLWEGLPLTGIEAQTSGLPIVMSDVIADETVVTDNVTRLSLSNSADVWAKTCLMCLAHTKERTVRNRLQTPDSMYATRQSFFRTSTLTAHSEQDTHKKIYNYSKNILRWYKCNSSFPLSFLHIKVPTRSTLPLTAFLTRHTKTLR